ncbi:ARM repeat superfamily protein isoform 2 [Hibiscus syriacus]|uniref:ARM repeat superfamily protein isoform 2 n=1 Tax=Hibiscus syriacus TaxID=106335 RepID=A0A6A2W9I4_HIBSY|nr:ARM repeat superfamily protein isoform 2 [Hibiscus syriacus]
MPQLLLGVVESLLCSVFIKPSQKHSEWESFSSWCFFLSTLNMGMLILVNNIYLPDVNYALGALYYLCNKSNREEILKPEVIDVIERYAAAQTVNNVAKLVAMGDHIALTKGVGNFRVQIAIAGFSLDIRQFDMAYGY